MIDRQKGLIRHALGLDNHNAKKAYRNHYASSFGTLVHADCLELVSLGLMERGQGLGYGIMFHVTLTGALAAGFTKEQFEDACR